MVQTRGLVWFQVSRKDVCFRVLWVQYMMLLRNQQWLLIPHPCSWGPFIITKGGRVKTPWESVRTPKMMLVWWQTRLSDKGLKAWLMPSGWYWTAQLMLACSAKTIDGGLRGVHSSSCLLEKQDNFLFCFCKWPPCDFFIIESKSWLSWTDIVPYIYPSAWLPRTSSPFVSVLEAKIDLYIVHIV